MRYSAHWPATIFAAIIFNAVMLFGFAYVLPQLMPAPKVEEVVEIEWLDVEADDAVVINEEAIPSDAQENLPTFNAQDLVVPEFKPPPIELPPPPEVKPVEIPKPKPQSPPAQPEQNSPQKISDDKKNSEAPAQQTGKQLLTKPPVTIMEVHPEKGSVLGYKGYIAFAVHIGKDGKVKSSEVLQSSGRLVVDEIARKAAEQWTFRPALDQFGRPMECDKIIAFDFTKDA